MTKNRILITGGAGLIGSNLAEKLARNPENKILLLDNFNRGVMFNIENLINLSNVQVIQSDIRNKDQVRELVAESDSIFHLAALRVTYCTQNPDLAFEVMAEGSYNLIKAAVEYHVKKFILASTAMVYGNTDVEYISEDHHTKSDYSLYGILKNFNEGLLRSFFQTHGLNYLALRFFNVYGPRMSISGDYMEVIPKWMEMIENGKSPQIFGDGSDALDFIYIDDLVDGLILAHESDSTDLTLNFGTGRSTTLLNLLETLLKVMKSNVEPEFMPARTVGKTKRKVADISKAKQVLEFNPSTSLEDGLTKFYTWWKNAKITKNTNNKAVI